MAYGHNRENPVTTLTTLIDYLNTLLEPGKYQDYCHNGLQVAGRESVHRLATGVTACQAFLDKAATWKADVVLVHHGLFWRNDPMRIEGLLYRRIKTLMSADMGLLAYHLPLDQHMEYGNNAQLAKRLGIEIDGPMEVSGGQQVGMVGRFPTPLSGDELSQRIEQSLDRPPLHIPGRHIKMMKIAWCSGGGQGFIEQAARMGVDAYLTGEISEPTTHIAREYGIHFFALGHHASERYGALALGEHLARKFGFAHQFIDIDNPA